MANNYNARGFVDYMKTQHPDVDFNELNDFDLGKYSQLYIDAMNNSNSEITPVNRTEAS